MYELTKTPFGKNTRFDLQNPSTGHAFGVVPSRGANVLDIRFGSQSILDGYATPEEVEGENGDQVVFKPLKQLSK
ncbi:MAG: hypothetical protein ACKVUS_15780 [Saprospiraceae bacterium]